MGQKANKNRSRRKQEFKENREDTILQPSILLLFHWQRLLGTRGEGWAADGNKEQFYRFPAPEYKRTGLNVKDNILIIGIFT